MWPSSVYSWAVACALIPGILGSPVQKQEEGARLVLDTNFPDPAFLQGEDGMWYAFGTNGNGKRIQVASSPDFWAWTLLDKEALITLAGWETEIDHWAPDVIRRNDGRYVMYYSGEAKEKVRHHCVGVAVSEGTDPTGPYIANPEPLSCRLDRGGSIDPSGFQDTDGSRYVVFKVDGNSVGHGGDCNNGVEPLVGTPILLQKVEEDGFTPIGDAVQILDRDNSDGPLVEAPNLIFKDGTYFLFYSTHCFTDPKYDVRYATSKSIAGPYTKSGDQLVKTGQYNLKNPGGGTVSQSGDKVLFHGFCGEDKRCTYAADILIQGDCVTML